MLDAAAGRILPGGGDAREPKRRRIGPRRVAIRSHQDHRAVPNDGIQVGERQHEPGRVDLHDLEPLCRIAGRGPIAVCSGGDDRRTRQHLVAEVALSQVLGALRRMCVCIDEPGQCDAAREIDGSGRRADVGADLRRGSGRHDRVATHGNGLDDPARGILRVDAAIQKHEIRGRRFAKPCGCVSDGDENRDRMDGRLHSPCSG